ncbi:MAG: hypothetical protein RLZZ391_182, partial [Bacteroidota bacterium]
RQKKSALDKSGAGLDVAREGIEPPTFGL